MPAKKKFSEELRSEAKLLRSQGLSLKDIALKLGITSDSVRYICAGIVISKECHRLNLAKSKGTNNYSTEILNEVSKKYLELKDAAKVAELFGLTVRNVKSIIFKTRTLLPKEVRHDLKVADMAKWRASLSKEKIEQLSKSSSERGKRYWENLSKDEFDYRNKLRIQKGKEAKERQTEEQRLAHSAKMSQIFGKAKLDTVKSGTWNEYFDVLCAKEGYIRLSDYKVGPSKMDFKCDKGHEFSMVGHNFMQNQRCPSCRTVISKGHQQVIDFINSLGFNLQKPQNINNRGTISKELDIYIPEHKFALEYNGLYFHSLKYPEIDKNQGAKPDDSLNKFKECESLGLKLFSIFDDEWFSDKQDLIKAMIKWRLNKFSGTYLHARDLEIRKLESNDQFKEFFDRNHLDGHTLSIFAYGLFYNSKLISCVSVRKNFRQEWEIARLATDYDYSVRGGAGKLITAVYNDLKAPIVSFSNNRLSNGDVYKQLGFTLIKENKPSYWYTDGTVRIWRFKCKRINDPEILQHFPTEKAQALGGIFGQMHFNKPKPLFKIEDCGHKKWILIPT